MHEATVCYLLRGSGDKQDILLGKRDSLFCNNIWNGPGGKLRKRETLLGCLRREVREEIGVHVKKEAAVHFASMDFYHPVRDDYRLEWRVHFFKAPVWEGVPRLVEGFSELNWFPYHMLPYDSMNADAKLWVPPCLNGVARDRLMIGEVYYGDGDMKIVDRLSFHFEEKAENDK